MVFLIHFGVCKALTDLFCCIRLSDVLAFCFPLALDTASAIFDTVCYSVRIFSEAPFVRASGLVSSPFLLLACGKV